MNTFLKILLWAARIWAAFAISFMLFMVVGHLFGDEEQKFSGASEIIGFALFPIGFIIGLFMCWKRPLLGGLVVIACQFGLKLVLPEVPLGGWFIALAGPAYLFVVHSLLHKRIQEGIQN